MTVRESKRLRLSLSNEEEREREQSWKGGTVKLEVVNPREGESEVRERTEKETRGAKTGQVRQCLGFCTADL